MNIEHFGGTADVADSASLDEVLAARFGDQHDVNEFWISGEQRYPLLSVQVCGELSCLHYFPEEDHPGFISVGQGGGAGGTAVFCTNTPTEEIEVEASAVVPFEQARQATHEFMRSGSQPTCVAWSEL
jgi:immunity protein Imm1 of predicted polymorphic toxin system